MSSRGFQSLQGPTDPSLKHSEIEGYQPVSRIGEVVINSFGAPFKPTLAATRFASHANLRAHVLPQWTRTSTRPWTP